MVDTFYDYDSDDYVNSNYLTNPAEETGHGVVAAAAVVVAVDPLPSASFAVVNRGVLPVEDHFQQPILYRYRYLVVVVVVVVLLSGS